MANRLDVVKIHDYIMLDMKSCIFDIINKETTFLCMHAYSQLRAQYSKEEEEEQ